MKGFWKTQHLASSLKYKWRQRRKNKMIFFFWPVRRTYYFFVRVVWLTLKRSKKKRKKEKLQSAPGWEAKLGNMLEGFYVPSGVGVPRDSLWRAARCRRAAAQTCRLLLLCLLPLHISTHIRDTESKRRRKKGRTVIWEFPPPPLLR